MKRTDLNKGLDLVEKYLKAKINHHKDYAYRNPAMRLAYMNALEAVQLARDGNIENLELLLNEQR